MISAPHSLFFLYAISPRMTSHHRYLSRSGHIDRCRSHRCSGRDRSFSHLRTAVRNTSDNTIPFLVCLLDMIDRLFSVILPRLGNSRMRLPIANDCVSVVMMIERPDFLILFQTSSVPIIRPRHTPGHARRFDTIKDPATPDDQRKGMQPRDHAGDQPAQDGRKFQLRHQLADEQCQHERRYIPQLEASASSAMSGSAQTARSWHTDILPLQIFGHIQKTMRVRPGKDRLSRKMIIQQVLGNAVCTADGIQPGRPHNHCTEFLDRRLQDRSFVISVFFSCSI